jgi:ferrous iron transport protein A
MTSSTASGLKRLSEVPVGGKAGIVQLLVPAEAQAYLMELGFVPGTEVEVVRKLPFHGPVIYRLQDAEVAIRHEVAERIQVRMHAPEDSGVT